MQKTLDKNKISELTQTALNVREHIIRMSTDGGCFIGASLSCADLIVYLYTCYLNTHKDNLNDENRDFLFLSKGHDVPALYGTFAELGFIDKKLLTHHLKTTEHIYWHPNRNVPGVEFHSGSLGHLLSVSIGVALDCKMRGLKNKVLVILGDGECNEGTIWEGALVAAAHKLDNLIAVIDRNKFQANIETEKLIPLEPLEDKFAAFGWNTFRVDGHDFNAMNDTFNKLKYDTQKPNIVIADTIRGKGLPSIEARADRWFVNFTGDEVQMLLKELHGEANADLTSETLMVR